MSLAPELVDELVRLREDEHRTTHYIAWKLGLHEARVTYWLLKNGVDPWDQNGHGRRRHNAFSEDEDRQMLELRRAGVKLNHIARGMRRPRTSVLIRIMLLEVRAELAMESDHAV